MADEFDWLTPTGATGLQGMPTFSVQDFVRRRGFGTQGTGQDQTQVPYEYWDLSPEARARANMIDPNLGASFQSVFDPNTGRSQVIGSNNAQWDIDPNTGELRSVIVKTGEREGRRIFFERQGDQYVPVREAPEYWNTKGNFVDDYGGFLLLGGALGAALGGVGAGAGAAGAGSGAGGISAADAALAMGGGSEIAAAGGAGAAAGAGSAAAGGTAAGGGWGNLLTALQDPRNLLQIGGSLYDWYQRGRAADAQEDAARQAMEFMAPWREAGVNALNRLQQLTGLAPGDPSELLQQDPGYQFRVSEAQKAIDRAAAAGGRLYSGRTLRDHNEVTQGLASQEFGNVYNRLAGLAGTGQVASGSMGRDAHIGGMQQAGGIIGQNNALQNMLRGIYGNWQLNK